MMLGWLEPVVVSESTTDIVLPAADEEMAAVKVPTARSNEYFMLEYRRTPDVDDGSGAPVLDGLVVYHLLESAHQDQDPPVMKVEPADSVILPGYEYYVESGDLFYPDNPDMVLPFVGVSYAGDAEVFRINNVEWATGGIRFDVDVLPLDAPESVLVTNSSFEDGAGTTPTGWQKHDDEAQAVFTWDDTTVRTGERSAAIENSSPGTAAWEKTLDGLVVGGAYDVCVWIKGKNIDAKGKVGGNVSATWSDEEGNTQTRHSDYGFGTFDFQEVCVSFQAETAEDVSIQCRLGQNDSPVTGKIWFDDISVYELYSAFSTY